MPVVSNTSPLSNLAIIGRLDLVWGQFGSILIPAAVAEELSRLTRPVGQHSLTRARQEGLLNVEVLQNRAAANVLSGQLDRGEAEAIALAAEWNAEWLLMDERDGRSLARQAGLRVTGVLGILTNAKLNGDIPAIKPELVALRVEARFFIAKGLEQQVLSSVGE